MIAVYIILGVLGILTAITGFTLISCLTEISWKALIPPTVIILGVSLAIYGISRASDLGMKKAQSSFTIVKIDSTHVYKVNETRDSLIIENR